jgi:hypothetical protein
MSKVHSGMRFHALSSFITEKFTGRKAAERNGKNAFSLT